MGFNARIDAVYFSYEDTSKVISKTRDLIENLEQVKTTLPSYIQRGGRVVRMALGRYLFQGTAPRHMFNLQIRDHVSANLRLFSFRIFGPSEIMIFF
jgi:hypothetical protein